MRLFGEFLLAVIEEWKGWLAGSLPMVALAVLSIETPITVPPLAWALMVFVAGLTVAMFRVYRAERTQREEAQKRLVPKLKCTFGTSALGSVKETQFRDGPQAIYARVKIEVESIGHVHDCTGSLVAFSRDGKEIFVGEKATLPFVPGELKIEKQDIRDGVPEYVDVLFVTAKNTISVTPKDWMLPASWQRAQKTA
jgi:hypothetical protein